jgi:hypothetical protein
MGISGSNLQKKGCVILEKTEENKIILFIFIRFLDSTRKCNKVGGRKVS